MNIDLAIVTRPEKYGVVNAPLKYTVQREDYVIGATADDGGNMQLTLGLAYGDVTADFPVGSTWVLVNDGVAQEVEVVSTSFSTYTFVTVNTPNVAVTGYINALSTAKNFRVYTEVYNIDDELVLTLKSAPNSIGLATISVSILKELLKPTITDALTGNVGDNDKLLNYYIRVRPDFDGVENTALITDWTTDIANPRYLLLAWNQLGEGNNFATRVVGLPTSKWLTPFDKLIATIGKPFALSFFKDNSTAYTLRVVNDGVITDTAVSSQGVVRSAIDTLGFTEQSEITAQLIALFSPTAVNYVGGPPSKDGWATVGGKPEVTLNTHYITDSALHDLDPTGMAGLITGGNTVLRLRIYLDIIAVANPITVNLIVLNDSSLIYSSSAVILNTAGEQFISYDITLAGEVDQIGIQLEQAIASGSSTVRIEKVEPIFECSEVKQIVAKCELPNTLQLCWNNGKGGTDFYSFDYNQFTEIERSIYGYKTQVYQLFATLVSINVWRALQDLVSNEQVYVKPIESLNDDFFKERMYQQVYLIKDGELYKAITNRLDNRTETRRELHDFVIELETLAEV
jgi:hypothetical protein